MPSFTPLFQPVTQEDCFDREEQLAALVEGEQHIALIGPRKSGKTSLFRQFLETQDSFIAVYYSVSFEETFDVFCQNYASEVIAAYLKFQHTYSPSLDETISGIFTHTVTSLATQRSDLRSFCSTLLTLNLREKDKGERLGILQLFLDIPYRLTASLSTKASKEIIVILDEFQFDNYTLA